ncbi:MAG: hypothetical protein FJ130_00975 [Deltaproteobacteria bacterium]|nr:hypothetical protein [Deltaproteobacteria bacterium]
MKEDTPTVFEKMCFHTVSCSFNEKIGKRGVERFDLFFHPVGDEKDLMGDIEWNRRKSREAN